MKKIYFCSFAKLVFRNKIIRKFIFFLLNELNNLYLFFYLFYCKIVRSNLLILCFIFYIYLYLIYFCGFPALELGCPSVCLSVCPSVNFFCNFNLHGISIDRAQRVDHFYCFRFALKITHPPKISLLKSHIHSSITVSVFNPVCDL